MKLYFINVNLPAESAEEARQQFIDLLSQDDKNDLIGEGADLEWDDLPIAVKVEDGDTTKSEDWTIPENVEKFLGYPIECLQNHEFV